MDEQAREPGAVPQWPIPVAMPLRPTRPGWITAVGVISIVLGCLGLLCGGVGTAWLAALPGLLEGGGSWAFRSRQPGMEQLLRMTEVSWYWTCTVAMAAVGIATSGLLLASGAGLLRQRSWARGLSIAWAVIALAKTGAGQAASIAAGFFNPLGLLFVALYLVYPIFLLALLVPQRRAAFFGPAEGRMRPRPVPGVPR